MSDTPTNMRTRVRPEEPGLMTNPKPLKIQVITTTKIDRWIAIKTGLDVTIIAADRSQAAEAKQTLIPHLQAAEQSKHRPQTFAQGSNSGSRPA